MKRYLISFMVIVLALTVLAMKTGRLYTSLEDGEIRIHTTRRIDCNDVQGRDVVPLTCFFKTKEFVVYSYPNVYETYYVLLCTSIEYGDGAVKRNYIFMPKEPWPVTGFWGGGGIREYLNDDYSPPDLKIKSTDNSTIDRENYCQELLKRIQS